jgi:hypothetical protein
VHRLLHVGVEILHAKAHAVEAQTCKVLKALDRDSPWIDLDRGLGIGRNAEVPVQRLHEPRQLRVVEEGRRPAAQMQLRDGLRPAECGAMQRRLDLQGLQVRRSAIMVPGDDLVARAVVADRLAERDVHVQRQRPRTALASLDQRLPVLLGAEGFDETVRGGIARVARPRHVVLPQQRLVDDTGGGDRCLAHGPGMVPAHVGPALRCVKIAHRLYLRQQQDKPFSDSRRLTSFRRFNPS